MHNTKNQFMKLQGLTSILSTMNFFGELCQKCFTSKICNMQAMIKLQNLSAVLEQIQYYPSETLTHEAAMPSNVQMYTYGCFI